MNKYRAIIDHCNFDKVKIYCGENFVYAPEDVKSKEQVEKWVADMVKAQNGPEYELSFSDDFNSEDDIPVGLFGAKRPEGFCPISRRAELQRRAEKGEISPRDYWNNMKTLFNLMSEKEKATEAAQCSA